MDRQSEVKIKIKVDDSDTRKLDDVRKKAEAAGGDATRSGAGASTRGAGQSYRPPPAPFMREGLRNLVTARGESQAFYQDPRAWMQDYPRMVGRMSTPDQAALHRYANYTDRVQQGRDRFEERERERAARTAAQEESKVRRIREREEKQGEREEKQAERQGERGRGRAWDTAKGFAFGAMAVGLGSSIQGFFLNSAQWTIEYSKGLKQIEAQYGKIADRATEIGHRYGYVAQQAMQATSAYGAEVGTFRTRREAVQAQSGVMAVSRAYGLEPGMVGGFSGRLSTLYGRNMAGGSTAGIIRMAERLGMGGGRLPEFMAGYRGTNEDLFLRTGAIGQDLEKRSAFAANLPSFFLGNNERARGASGERFLQGLQGMGQGLPMQTYMLRAMNYGAEGGPSFIDAMKRTEAGLTSDENLREFASFTRKMRGNDVNSIFSMLLEPGKSAGMNIEGIEALARKIQSGEIENLKASTYIPGRVDEKKLQDRAGRMIAAGSRQEVQLEQLRGEFGPDMLSGVMDLTGMARDILGMTKDIIGAKPTEVFKEVASGLKELTGAVKQLTALIPKEFTLKSAAIGVIEGAKKDMALGVELGKLRNLGGGHGG